MDLLGKLEGQPAQFSGSMGLSVKKPMLQESKDTENRHNIKMQESKGKRSKSQKSENATKMVETDAGKQMEESRHEVLKRLLSGGERKPSPSDTTLATSRTEKEEVWSSVDSKRRPNSGRLTGLRGKILSAGEERHGSVKGRELETSEAPSKSLSRPESGRTSGLRGEMMSVQHCDEGTLADSRAGSRSGRTTGLRGELTQQDEINLKNEKSSLSHYSRGDVEGRGPRLNTAVLAHGHRPLLLGVSGSDTCLLPEITSETSHQLVRSERGVRISNERVVTGDI